MGIKEDFLKIKNPQGLLDFMKRHKDLRYDADMAKHFNEVARQHSNGETPENHTDPREAFIKKRGD